MSRAFELRVMKDFLRILATLTLISTSALGVAAQSGGTFVMQKSVIAGGGSGVPVGTVVAYAGPISTIPAGWLVCDGRRVSRTQSGSLFVAIGTSLGKRRWLDYIQSP